MKLSISVLALAAAMWTGNANAADSAEQVQADVLNQQSFLEESSNPTALSLDFNGLDVEAFHRRHRDHRGHRPFPRHPTSCFAKNGRGIVFRVSGFASSWRLQDEAVRFCRRNSYRPNSCRALGCRR